MTFFVAFTAEGPFLFFFERRLGFPHREEKKSFLKSFCVHRWTEKGFFIATSNLLSRMRRRRRRKKNLNAQDSFSHTLGPISRLPPSPQTACDSTQFPREKNTKQQRDNKPRTKEAEMKVAAIKIPSSSLFFFAFDEKSKIEHKKLFPFWFLSILCAFVAAVVAIWDFNVRHYREEQYFPKKLYV